MSGGSLEDALAWNLGRYTLHGEIASGGMATVHIGRLAGSAGFSKMVAIKRLHAQFAKDPDFVSMFVDEARLAARVNHPNVVQPLDVIATDGEVFLVMEYIVGETLSRIARFLRPRGDRMPLKIAGAIMVGVLHGLHAAHEASDERGHKLGIVHRDVSPQNILVGTDGVPRVLDFGIAKAADRAHSTREGDLKGKLAYMAPEQLSSEADVDRRTDIYAAAIVLWEMLTGQRLFDADYQSAILQRVQNADVRPPSKVVGDLPPKIDEVVMKALSKDPKKRFTTAREMAIELEMYMPLATPSKVGEWIESVAHESLTKRAARIAEIESHLPIPSASEQARAVLNELGVGAQSRGQARAKAAAEATRSWKQDEREERSMGRDSAPRVNTASIVVVQPEDLPPQRGRSPTLPPLTPPGPRSNAPSPWAATVQADPGAASVRAYPANAQTMTGVAVPQAPQSRPGEGTPPPGTMRTPAHTPASLAPPQVHDFNLPPVAPVVPFELPAGGGTVNGPQTKRRSSGLFMVFVLLLLAAVGFFVGLPSLVRRSYLTAAERRGISLTIDEVDVSLHRIRLLGVSASTPDMPGVYTRAKEVVFNVRDGNPEVLRAYDVDITVDGTYPAVRDGYNRWLSAHPLSEGGTGKAAGIERIDIDKGHLTWSRFAGDTSKLELDDVRGSITRTEDHALGDDFSITSGRITVGTPLGTLGPWSGALTHTPGGDNAKVALGPPSADAPTVSYTDTTTQGMLFDLSMPRSTIEKVGLPKSLMGVALEDSMQIEGTLRYARPSPAKVEAQTAFAIYGLKLAGAAAPVDVRFQARLMGDPSGAIQVQDGLIVFGSFKGKLSGSATFVRDGFRAEAQWKTAPKNCSQVMLPDPTATIPQIAADASSLERALGQTPGASQTAVSGTFLFDSRDIAQTRFTAVPSNKCGAKIFTSDVPAPRTPGVVQPAPPPMPAPLPTAP